MEIAQFMYKSLEGNLYNQCSTKENYSFCTSTVEMFLNGLATIKILNCNKSYDYPWN